MHVKKRVAATSVVTLALIVVFETPPVFADSFGVVIQRGNGYGIVGGDTYRVENPPISWRGLTGKSVLITTDLADWRPGDSR